MTNISKHCLDTVDLDRNVPMSGFVWGRKTTLEVLPAFYLCAFPFSSEFISNFSLREKLATLRMTGEAVRKRRREFNERPEAINQFGQCMQLAQKAVDSFKAGDEKFNHLDVAEVEKVQKAIAEKQDWFSRMCADVSKLVCFLLLRICICICICICILYL